MKTKMKRGNLILAKRQQIISILLNMTEISS